MDLAPGRSVCHGAKKSVVAGVEVSEQVCLQIPDNGARKIAVVEVRGAYQKHFTSPATAPDK